MARALKHWRESASLIIASKRMAMNQPRQTVVNKLFKRQTQRDERANEEMYRILLLKRSSESPFMPSVYVFPGGMVDDTDFSQCWQNILGDNENLLKAFTSKQTTAPIFQQTTDSETCPISKVVALRITAIRETFEESGILLARPKSDLQDESFFTNDSPSFGTVCNMPELLAHEWRTRIMSDPHQFAVMCQELEMVPDIWSLYEWSNWLTPLLRKKRFDTAFFVSCIDEAPEVVDSHETEHGVWANPSSILNACSEGTLNLAPPQIYEMSRLIRMENAEELLNFAWKRSAHGVERWMPVIYQCLDGLCFVLPGDDLYPAEPDWTGGSSDGPIVLNETVEELQKKYPHHNRAFMHKDRRTFLFCNIKFVDGHILPLEHHNKSQFQPKM